MAKIQIAILLAVLIAAVPARADDDELPSMTPEQFSDRLTIVIRAVADHYYHEIDNGELLRWGIKGLYDHRGKTMQARLGQRLDKAHGLELKELRRLLTDVANDCGGDFRGCADVAVGRMLGRLDGPTQLIESSIGFGRSTGIGVQLAVDSATGMIRVQYPYFNGPAYRAGLRSGDLIADIVLVKREVPNEPPPGVEVIPTKGLTRAAAQWHLAGEPGKSLYLNVRRPGTDKVLQFTVPYAKDEPEIVFGVHRGNDDRWDHWLDPHRKIGYVRLSGFCNNTHKLLANELAALRIQGMKGLVLDMRGNAGGLVPAATSVAGILVGDAKLYSVRVRNQEEEVFQGKPIKAFRDFPMVCLVNGDTAHMGEVLAACLQDNCRAVIAGERTRGNASIQHYSVHGDTFFLKITAGVFFRPNGKKLDRMSPPGKPSDEWGVTPDPGYELKLTADERNQLRGHFESQLVIPPPGRAAKEQQPAFKDRQLDMAVNYLQQLAKAGDSSSVRLSASEQKYVRQAAYGHGLTHEIKRIYANKPNATLDLLLKIVEVGRDYDGVQAAGLIAGLSEDPAYGAIVTKLWSLLGDLDNVIEGASETYRDRLYAGCLQRVRDAEKARTKQRKLDDELNAALKSFRDAGGVAQWQDHPVKFLMIRRFVRPEHHIPLSKLPVLPAVKKLQLNGYDFDDDDLAALAKWTHLERLDIIFCRDVTDKGMAHLRSLKKLKSLIIWGPNKITSAGMQHVRSFPDLESLEIQQTKIGDDGVEPIRHLHKLSKLMLSLTGASPAAVKRLEEALPKCEVFHSEE